jgi:hypothetical protein
LFFFGGEGQLKGPPAGGGCPPQNLVVFAGALQRLAWCSGRTPFGGQWVGMPLELHVSRLY